MKKYISMRIAEKRLEMFDEIANERMLTRTALMELAMDREMKEYNKEIENYNKR